MPSSIMELGIVCLDLRMSNCLHVEQDKAHEDESVDGFNGWLIAMGFLKSADRTMRKLLILRAVAKIMSVLVELCSLCLRQLEIVVMMKKLLLLLLFYYILYGEIGKYINERYVLCAYPSVLANARRLIWA